MRLNAQPPSRAAALTSTTLDHGPIYLTIVNPSHRKGLELTSATYRPLPIELRFSPEELQVRIETPPGDLRRSSFSSNSQFSKNMNINCQETWMLESSAQKNCKKYNRWVSSPQSILLPLHLNRNIKLTTNSIDVEPTVP
jgi:hypothetical protein